MLPTYANLLGVKLLEDGDGAPLCVLQPSDDVVGRPSYLHGGAISGLLELAAYAALRYALRGEQDVGIKPINVTVEFMRNGYMVETRAIGRVLRMGSRIANITAEAWQDDPKRPIALARMMFSLRR